MLMILARLVRSESFRAVVKVRSPHTGPEVWYPRKCQQTQRVHLRQQQLRPAPLAGAALRLWGACAAAALAARAKNLNKTTRKEFKRWMLA